MARSKNPLPDTLKNEAAQLWDSGLTTRQDFVDYFNKLTASESYHLWLSAKKRGVAVKRKESQPTQPRPTLVASFGDIETSMLEKAALLRKELKNERDNTIDPTSGDFTKNGGNGFTAFRTTFEDRGGQEQTSRHNGSTPVADNRSYRSDRQGTKTKPIGVGPSVGRFGIDDSSTHQVSAGGTSSSTSTSTSSGSSSNSNPIGNLSTDGQAPERLVLEPNKPQGKFNAYEDTKKKKPLDEKQPTENLTKKLLGKGKTFSSKEANDSKEPLQSALPDHFQVIDSYLWQRQQARGIETHNQPIWSDIDELQIEKLARMMLQGSQKNEAVAAVTRAVIDVADYLVIGAIFLPRIQQTVAIMRETHKPVERRIKKNENSNQ